MSSSPALPRQANTEPSGTGRSQGGPCLVCMPTSSSAEAVQQLRVRLSALVPQTQFIFAAPEGVANGSSDGTVTMPMPLHAHPAWLLPSSDYAAAADLIRRQGTQSVLLLGSDVESLSDQALQALGSASTNDIADVVLPRYDFHPHQGLVSAALLYPLTRTLFGAPVHLPLPLDISLSARAAERLGASARRPGNISTTEALLWPVAEAAVANLRVVEVHAGPHAVPPPEAFDLNTLLGEILGSVFADIEAKAAFWQRARVPTVTPQSTPTKEGMNGDLAEVAPMVDSFRNAFTNLQQIWALVLPPHSLLALKKLSLAPAEEFRMPPSLWARSVYEFVLAFHLRTLNRGHLLGALTPLYLAWVASYLGQVGKDASAAATFIEHNAAVFEAEKPYLVSRWRWPDRFNP